MRPGNAFEQFGIATAVEPESSDAARAAAIVAEAMLLRRDTADQWLADICDSLAALETPPLAASAIIFAPHEAPPFRRAAHAAVAGIPEERAAKAFLAEARRGFPSDDVLFLERAVDKPGPASIHRREDLLADPDWMSSTLCRFRATIGLHDFLQALFPFRAVGGFRLLVLQIDAVEPDLPPEEQTFDTFQAVAPHIFRGFYRAFVGLALLRDRLLGMVTPAQRLIVPLLAEGMSESEIADRLERSRHTIHDHTKAIYKAWGINSRFELRDIWHGLEPSPDLLR